MIHSIGVADLHPVVAEGVRAILSRTTDLDFAGAADSLTAAGEMVHSAAVSVLLLDEAFAHEDGLAFLKASACRPDMAFVIWGAEMSSHETARVLKAGALGIMRKTARPSDLIACLRSAAAGTCYIDKALFRGRIPSEAIADVH